jgi:hypothetical protein
VAVAKAADRHKSKGQLSFFFFVHRAASYLHAAILP